MKNWKRLLIIVLVVCMMTGVLTIVAACNKDCGIGKHTDDNHDGICDVCSKATVFKHVDADGDKKCDTCGKDIVYTMNDYVSTTPSNWNELSSTDANDDAIMGTSVRRSSVTTSNSTATNVMQTAQSTPQVLSTVNSKLLTKRQPLSKT